MRRCKKIYLIGRVSTALFEKNSSKSGEFPIQQHYVSSGNTYRTRSSMISFSKSSLIIWPISEHFSRSEQL
jgi:hypothetical protein